MAAASSACAFSSHPNPCLLDEHDRMLFQHSHPPSPDPECATLEEGFEGFSGTLSQEYSQNPIPFTWTKGPEHFQRIIEATKQYQAAHPKQPRQRKGKENNIKD